MMERSSDSHEPSNWNSFEASINNTIRMYNLMYPPALQDAIRNANLSYRLRAAYVDAGKRKELVKQADAEVSEARPDLYEIFQRIEAEYAELEARFDEMVETEREKHRASIVALFATFFSSVGNVLDASSSAALPAYGPRILPADERS